MKVLKFGGTSVGSVNSILSVKQIVEAVEEPVIVVVSALGGITDKLINTSQMAANGDSAYEKEYREIVNRHIEMVYTVIPAGNERTVLLDKVNELLSELKDIFQGIYLRTNMTFIFTMENPYWQESWLPRAGKFHRMQTGNS